MNTVHHNGVNASHVLLPVVPVSALPRKGVLIEEAVASMLGAYPPEKRAALEALGADILSSRARNLL